MLLDLIKGTKGTCTVEAKVVQVYVYMSVSLPLRKDRKTKSPYYALVNGDERCNNATYGVR